MKLETLDKMIGLMEKGVLTVEKMTTPLSYAQMCLMGYATREGRLFEYNNLLRPSPYTNLCSAYKRAMATGTSANEANLKIAKHLDGWLESEFAAFYSAMDRALTNHTFDISVEKATYYASVVDVLLVASTKTGAHNYTSTKEAIAALANKNYGYVNDRNPYLADYASRMVRGMAQALLETTMPFVSVVGAEIRQLH
jgi:hypothetical protein